MQSTSLQQRALNFWLNPAAWIHESWREALQQESAPAFLSSLWRQAAYSRFLFERFELTHPNDFGFEAPHARLALLESEALETGLLCIAACFHASSLAVEVDGARLRQARHALGDTAFAYARDKEKSATLADMHKAPFYSRTNSLRIGLWAAEHGFPEDEQFRRRLQLKLPAGLASESPPSDLDTIDESHLTETTLSIFTETLPECSWLAD